MTVGSTTLKVKLKDEEEEKKSNNTKYPSIYGINSKSNAEGNEIKLEQKQEV